MSIKYLLLYIILLIKLSNILPFVDHKYICLLYTSGNVWWSAKYCWKREVWSLQIFVSCQLAVPLNNKSRCGKETQHKNDEAACYRSTRTTKTCSWSSSGTTELKRTIQAFNYHILSVYADKGSPTKKNKKLLHFIKSTTTAVINNNKTIFKLSSLLTLVQHFTCCIRSVSYTHLAICKLN